MDRSLIDAASGGALRDMTPFEARCLIEKMASNSQQFNARSGDAIVVRGVHDVGTNAARQDKLETKIDSLTTLITQLAINQQKSSMERVCGICTSSDHYSDMCPSLLEPRTGDHPEAYATNIYNNRPPHKQQHYDPPSSSTYNPGWKNQAPFQNNNAGQNRPSYECKRLSVGLNFIAKQPLKPPIVRVRLWVEVLHEILFPHFFHPTLNTRESRTTFRTVVYEIQLYGE
ncbi:hypothetical protein Lal_00015283 [Lupinus albus]|nr:hypothetical protein Lal_00015283 [Lupinus albus]